MAEDYFQDDMMLVYVPDWENKKREILESRNVFFINGELNDNMIGSTVRGLLSVIHSKQPPQTIVLYINSEGGELWHGWLLFDVLEYAKTLGFKVVTIGAGKVQSAATIPFLAGNPKLTFPNTIFTIHEASSWLSGKTSEQKDYLNFLTHCEKRYIRIVTTRSKITQRMLRQRAYRKDWFFTADDAVKLGFADALLFSEENPEPALSLHKELPK